MLRCCQGARCKKCLQLAQLHSDAVDFPKTGRSISFPRELRVQAYPDFMMKKARVPLVGSHNCPMQRFSASDNVCCNVC